jgi:HPt (histidine-containing phosphotransfer) domain-containing protein
MLARKLDHWLPLARSSPIERQVLAEVSGGDLTLEREMLSDFRQVNEADIRQLQRAMDEQDAGRIAHISHRITGACRAIGAKPFASTCEMLERAARDNDWPAIRHHAQKFFRELARLNAYLNAL